MNKLFLLCALVGLGAALQRGSAAAPAKGDAVRVSWGDNIVIGKGLARLDTPGKIREAMRLWREREHARYLIWRVSGIVLAREFNRSPKSISRYWRISDRIFKQFDPAKAAVQAAHANGMKIFAWLCIYDEGCPPDVLYGRTTPFPWQSKFTAAHPEYLVVDRSRTQRHWGVLEYLYPQARAYKVRQLVRFLKDYDFDGLYVCTRSHSPPAEFADQYGFNDVTVSLFRRRYGVDILTQPFDKEKWRRLRGEGLTMLLRDLRQAAPAGRKILVAIPVGRYIGPPYGNMYLDWETWLDKGFADGLVTGVVSGKWLYPDEKLTDKQKGYLSSMEEGIGQCSRLDEARRVYGPACARRGAMLFVRPCAEPLASTIRACPGVTGFVVSEWMALTPHVFVPDQEKLAFENARFTVDFWLYARRVSGAPRLVSKYDHTLPDNAGRGWEVMLVNGGQVTFRLNDGAREWTLTSQGRAPARRWTHVACVSEGAGGRLRIYLNGRLDPASAPAPARVRRTPVALRFGEYGRGGVRRFNGLLDNVRLTAAALAFKEPPGPQPATSPATTALWTFDRIEGRRIPNAAGDAALDARVDGPTSEVTGPGRPGFGRAFDAGRG